MAEHIFYYFIKNVETGEQKIEVTDIFIGDPGEHIFIKDQEYVIEDYAEEFEELELPEDYSY